MLILDTGVLFAALDRDDRDHTACKRLLTGKWAPFLVPAPVLPEVDYLVTQALGPAPMFALVDDIARGALAVVDLIREDYVRIAEVLRKYADCDVGFVDAAVLAIVERMGEKKLATLDHRHFGGVLRARHVSRLKLVPELDH